MLVALRMEPVERVEAGKDVAPGDFQCPECRWPVILKRGRVKVPHFAHQPGSQPCASGGESVTHMRAKTLLAKQFRAQGYEVVLEEAHPRHQRRVDVAVTLIDRAGAVRRIAVEVQDSAISVDEVKRRTTADRHAGFFATLWVFTLSRLRRARSVLPGYELRLPEEMRYLINRWRTPIAVLDIEHEQLFLVSTATAVREGESYHDEYGGEQWSAGRILKATKQVFTVPGEFALAAVSGRYASPGRPDYTAGFRPAVEPEHPWRIVTCLPGRAPLSRDVGNAPGNLLQWSSLISTVDDGGSVTLTHLPTERLWHLVVKVEYDDHRSYRWKLQE